MIYDHTMARQSPLPSRTAARSARRFPWGLTLGAAAVTLAVVVPMATANPPGDVFQAATTSLVQTTTTINAQLAPPPPSTVPPGATPTPPATAPAPPTSGPKTLLPSTTVPAEKLDDIVVQEDPPDQNGQPASSSFFEAVPVVIGGPASEAKTENGAAFVFIGQAGQTIAVRSNRKWSLTNPLGRNIASTEDRTVDLQDSGKYLVEVQPGISSPAKVQVLAVDPNTIVTNAAVGQDIAFSAAELRPQLGRVAIVGGQRYRLTTPASTSPATVCAEDWTTASVVRLACVTSNNIGVASAQFVTSSDQTVSIVPQSLDVETGAVSTVKIEQIANDIVVDTATNPRVDQTPAPGQSVVIPFWGSPAERAVLSSPVEGNVSTWGQPWIDREEGSNGRVKVFAVPVTFDPGKQPFVSWTGVATNRPEDNQRTYGVYRGEDTPANVPTTGEPVTIRNKPWFAGVASLTFAPGERYAIQVTGKNIRPMSVALRDPSGKFTSNLSPWQWTDSNGDQRAITTVSADRAGKWALEMRPAGNNVRDMSVSVIKVGGNGSYEGVIDVDDTLSIGEATDVQLGPNEFARLTVKLNSFNPQIIQPEVLRYRNKTFQPTAVDMSVWDSKGRLVWSNNRNLEEEVLSGRLGQEPQLSEKYATVSSSEPYTLIIDPHVDLAGRFRVSVKSTPVVTDVKLGDGAIAILPGGTSTGVVEVRQPTRYRVTGATACLLATSLVEWSAAQTPRRCVTSGRTISLAPGVHRFSLTGANGAPLSTPGSFAVVPSGGAPDPVATLDAAIDGATVRVPPQAEAALLRINVGQPGTRLAFEEFLRDSRGKQITAESGGTIVRPDGSRTDVFGTFVAPSTGVYSLWVEPSDQPQDIRVRRAQSEVQTTTLAIGAKSKLFTLSWGQRLEATVKISKKTRIGFDTFNARFLYAADGKERRYGGYGDVTLPAGTYRLVFIGNGQARVALKKLKLLPEYDLAV